MSESIQHRLQERVKELTALHEVARLLQDPRRAESELIGEVLGLLPPAWQWPELAEARVCCGDRSWSTPGFRPTEWMQSEAFLLRNGESGSLAIAYRECPEPARDQPFLDEEQDLARSVAELLRGFFEHRRDDDAILAANERLERLVAERTASLRRMAAEVSLAEERERRRIAEDLHDHLGQGLALIKIRLQRLRGDAVFGGHGAAIDELVELSDQAIRYSRDLTCELSPPMLYELGLGPALEWLGAQTTLKQGIEVEVRDGLRQPLPDDVKVMLWKSVRELLHNVVKHADAGRATVSLGVVGDEIVVEVSDDGCGFDRDELPRNPHRRFGLFSIEERLLQLGGRMDVESSPGKGATIRLRFGREKVA